MSLRVENLTKIFGHDRVVDNLSLEVPGGAFVVLLGPSGCGKTTTLRCVAGLEQPDSGDIYIGDTRINKVAPKDRDVAMVFQNYALYEHMSIYDNIAFPLRMKKYPRDEIDRKVKETARSLKIDTHLTKRPRQLSGGEQQRVALARAIVRKPKVFLMDEPLSNLDAKMRVTMRTELRALHKNLGVTTLYVTHDQAEAMALADRVAIMSQGKVQQYASPLTVYRKPCNSFVAGFVGVPPMNLNIASVVDEGNYVLLETPEFQYRLPSGALGPIESLGERRVSIGVRPEDVQVSRERTAQSCFEAVAFVIESLGIHEIIDLKVGETIWKAVVSSDSDIREGERVWCGFSSQNVRIFDSQGVSIG